MDELKDEFDELDELEDEFNAFDKFNCKFGELDNLAQVQYWGHNGNIADESNV